MWYIHLILTPFLFAAALCFPAVRPATAAGKPPVKWIVEKSSTLKISGRSNINSFVCETNGYFQNDTISVSEGEPTGKPVRLAGSLQIDIAHFDCHSKVITNDLRHTLKAKEYPKLSIHFLTLDRFPDFTSSNRSLKGWVEIEMAGVRRTFQLAYEFSRKCPESFLLHGARTFSFSDFKLTPPQKLGGAIKIKDEFVVNFQLGLRAI